MNKIKNNPSLLMGLVIAIVALGLIVYNVISLQFQSNGYRVIQVYGLDGDSEVERGSIGVLEPYVNMMLQTEDKVSTFEASYLRLKMDSDKYMLVEPNTKMHLVAEGNAKDSKTVINIEEGSVVSNIQNPLSKDSTYEVNTPNSTMAIRGTTFRITCFYDETGVSHTTLAVYDGKVECHLVSPDGTVEEEAVYVEEGNLVKVWGDDTESDFVRGDNDEVELEEVDYEELKLQVLVFLDYVLDMGEELTATQPYIEELINDKIGYHTVTFTYNGFVFATQEVLNESRANYPSLKPSLSGYWDFDFDTPIIEDVTIRWVQ